MALPLKSGADLYNQQLIRAAIWNYSADGIDSGEYSTGLIYFNTNPSSNMYQKLRFRTATEWKTIAFAEDLDVASNADFVALKEKVDAFLEGDVDSDGVLDNLKEIQKFLDNYSSATDLTEILNTKLDKTGGTITSPSHEALVINRTGGHTPYLTFNSDGVTLGRIGFDVTSKEFIASVKGASQIILHLGNVGSYAMELDGSNARATKLTSSESLDNYKYGFYSYVNGISPTNSFGDNTALFAFTSNRGNDTWQIAFDGNGITNTAGPRFGIRGNFAGQGWTSWYRIATTNSNVASATKLETARTIWGQSFDGTGNVSGSLKHTNGWSFLHPSNNYIIFGFDYAANSKPIYIDGAEIYMRYATSHTTGITLNSSGNVTIGSTDKASSHKLWVEGDTNVTGNISTGGNIIINNEKHYQAIDSNGQSKNILYLSSANNLWLGYDTSMAGYNTMVAGNIVNLRYGQNRDYGLILNASGNVTIGGIDKAGENYKLWVHGDTNITKNLTVAKNVVAEGTIACKGIAEVGTTAAEGTVDKHAEVIEAGQQSYTINHQLHTKEITVCIYEMGGEETVIILTDVTVVSDDVIRVEFGRATDVKHRVVVMG